MTKDLIKSLISEYQVYVSQVELIPRNVELVDGLNYVFVGLRHAGKSYLMFQRVAQLIEQGHKKEEILKEVVYVIFPSLSFDIWIKFIGSTFIVFPFRASLPLEIVVDNDADLSVDDVVELSTIAR